MIWAESILILISSMKAKINPENKLKIMAGDSLKVNGKYQPQIMPVVKGMISRRKGARIHSVLKGGNMQVKIQMSLINVKLTLGNVNFSGNRPNTEMAFLL